MNDPWGCELLPVGSADVGTVALGLTRGRNHLAKSKLTHFVPIRCFVPPASPLRGEEKMMTVTIFVAVALVGLWAFHRIGAVLDARLARKELDERIAQLDQVVEDAFTTELRMRQRLERKRPVGRLLAAVRDEPTTPLR
jgi:hypothetical protein